MMTPLQHAYEVRPRRDYRGFDLISDVLPFGRLWYGEPNAINNAIGYAKFRSSSHNAVGGRLGNLVRYETAHLLIWFGVSGRLKNAVAAVRANGGTVQGDIHSIGGYGFRAEVLDSEGNCIALYSETDT
jgi:predicted enzyme related to lactoylglutathione lyase